MVRFLWIVVLALVFAHSTAFALAPPAGQETLCSVMGEVIATGVTDTLYGEFKKEARHASTFWVKINVKSIRAVDASYTGSFCHLPSLVKVPGLFEGKKRVSDYKICDGTTELEAGMMVRGIVGRSIGGGPYCIEHIEVLGAKR